MNTESILKKYIDLRDQLVSERNTEGFWTGELSTSALSTAVAIVALKVADNTDDKQRVDDGFRWLCRNINADGGYGDTPRSVSNISTTLLCYAAVYFCQTGNTGSPVLKEMEKWLSGNGIEIDSDSVVNSILKFYGKDYTFSVPILSMLTLCGVIPSSSLEKIPGLPFELAMFPASFYRFLNLRVVSYALPALIAVGIYLHKKGKKGTFTRGLIRKMFTRPAIMRLNGLVPDSGGFLEAIPLTGFVAMCLTASGENENRTVIKGIEFVRNQQRGDGGWPIDTDLSTWVTTLSVKALGEQVNQALNEPQRAMLRDHLLRLQYKTNHPFNGAKAGGWGWTSYTGSVPDADDTPGAILALLEIYSGTEEELTAIGNGCKWLIDMQNSDGGFPTFCKGWGKLPFDRSCADLTGHALLALMKSAGKLSRQFPPGLTDSIGKTIKRAISYLGRHQSDDGSWLPLWFGNQFTENRTNPVYGTARVCIYLADCLALHHPGQVYVRRIEEMFHKAQDYLVLQQNIDGSWGGQKGIPGSIEETSLAVCALSKEFKEVSVGGISWLEKHEQLTPAPIGLYFAMLWYHEKMYPLIYYTEALRRFLTCV